MNLQSCPVPNTYLAKIQGHILFRTESLDTIEKAQKLLKYIQGIAPKKNLRVLFCQVNHSKNDWDLIQRQHRQIVKLNDSLKKSAMAHLNLPINPVFIPKADLSEFSDKVVKQLYRQLNVEGWMTLSHWLNEEFIKILKTLKPEAVEEYQLQARLEDFGIETHSLFINDLEKEVQSALLEIEAGEGTTDLFSLEKKVIALRERLKTGLKTKYLLLIDIVNGIESIEKAHPELIPYKTKAFLLASLIGSNIHATESSVLTELQSLFLLQLLIQKLGGITVVNSDTAVERTNIAFSLMLAIAELSTVENENQLISSILNWKEASESPLKEKMCLHFFEKLKSSFNHPILGAQKTALSNTAQENQELLSYIFPSKFPL